MRFTSLSQLATEFLWLRDSLHQIRHNDTLRIPILLTSNFPFIMGPQALCDAIQGLRWDRIAHVRYLVW